MNAVLVGIIVYVVGQLVIGAVVSRGIRSDTDYLLAGRRLGYVMASFSIFATWFGAETCIGSAGQIHAHGLSAGSHDPFGYALCLLLMGVVFAAPLWRRQYVTLADLYRQRFGAGVERLAVLLMVPTSVLWAAAQVRAFGQVLSATSDIPLVLTITIAAAVVVIYTSMGGMLADAVTDIVQGGALLLGLVVALFYVLGEMGGVGPALAAIEPHRLSLVPRDASLLTTLEDWMVPICGSVVAQELVSRVLASRSAVVARRSAVAATCMYLTVGLIPAFIGLLGPHLAPDLEDPEQLLATVIHRHASTLFTIVFLGALVSAILSTVDSALLASSALLTENLVASFHPAASPTTRLRVSRVGVVLLGLVAYVLAIFGPGIYELVEDASSFGSAGLLVLMLLGLFTSFGGRASGFASLLAGVGVFMWANYVAGLDFPFVTSLAAALAAYVLAGLVAPGRRRARGGPAGAGADGRGVPAG